MKNKERMFLSNVKLSGYKSIDRINVNFVAGLNIIIGKNAVGKTNFLNFLNNSINLNFSSLNNFESSYEIIKEKISYNFSFIKKTNLQIILLDKKNIFNVKKSIPEYQGTLKIVDQNNNITGEFSTTNENEKKLFINQLEFDKTKIKSTYIKHGVPKSYKIIDEPLNLELFNKHISDDFINLFFSEDGNHFFGKLLDSLITLEVIDGSYFNKRLRKEESVQKFLKEKRNNYKSNLQKNLKFLDDLRLILSEYSPISNIRINENFLLEIDSENEKILIKNFFLEYYIDKKWYTFEDLSDGTKRLFYIISEIFTIEFENINTPELDILNLILIEEPELGIHPHQLYRLMLFIKEKSKNSQIIVTTHSPLVLDILENEELKSIIIAEKNEGKSSFNKLSSKKLEKAELYLNELNLSDFWLNSDLED